VAEGFSLRDKYSYTASAYACVRASNCADAPLAWLAGSSLLASLRCTIVGRLLASNDARILFSVLCYTRALPRMQKILSTTIDRQCGCALSRRCWRSIAVNSHGEYY